MSDPPSCSRILSFRRSQPGVAEDDLAVKLWTVFETNPDPMWIFDVYSLLFLAVNRAAVRRYGYSRSEFLDMKILDIRPSEDVIPLLHKELRDKKHNSDAERWRHRARHGSVFDVEITSRELTYGGRKAAIVIAREINPRKEMKPIS